MTCLPVSIFARIVLEQRRNVSSTFSPVQALVSKNIKSRMVKFVYIRLEDLKCNGTNVATHPA